MREIEPVLAAYVAGLVDGEGSIQLNPGSTGGYWTLRVQVSSSAAGFLEKLRDDLGGAGKICSYQPKRWKDQRRCSNWNFYGQAAVDLLIAIRPYLRLKKEQAEVAIEFRSLALSRWETIPDNIRAKRTVLGLRMRELNARTGKNKHASRVGI